MELKAIIRFYFSNKIDLFSLKDFPAYTPPEERGSTFVENAEIKAQHALKTLHIEALAEDSGLVVPALNGEPGIYSRRYAGKSATEKENRQKLIEKVKHLKEEDRTAYFACALSFAQKASLTTTKGSCEGLLTTEPKGRFGFGYDALFMKYGYRKTMAQLSQDVKNCISHRRKAFDKLASCFDRLLKKEYL